MDKTRQSDLRSFLRGAEAAGKLHRVKDLVDPKTNMGTLSSQSDRTILFENVAGYEGWTVVANLLGNRDLEAVALNTTREGVLPALVKGFDRGPQPMKFVDNADAPVKEVIWKGDDADLRRLPIITHSELDAGPYIGGAIGITKDPESGMQNTTMPRTLVLDGKKCPWMLFSPHTRMNLMKYAAMKRPMPMALVIGHHPAWEIAGASSIYHADHGELQYTANILNEEADFVRCETIDLAVPARAEVIVEGEVMPGELAPEGPFGNYLGSYSYGPSSVKGVEQSPVFNVKCITKRKDAIYRHIQSTVFTEHQRIVTISVEANLFRELRNMGVHVHDVFCPEWGCCKFTVIQMSPMFPGEARDALLKALEWSNTTISLMSTVALGVNPDVNIYDARELIFAMTTRTNWKEDVVAISGFRASPLVPGADIVHGSPLRVGSKAMIDATHLEPVNESQEWDFKRSVPMGQGAFHLADFLEQAKVKTV